MVDPRIAEYARLLLERFNVQPGWPVVTDLRGGGRIYADGELIQENGTWLLTS